MGQSCGACKCTRSKHSIKDDVDLKEKQNDVFKEKMLVIKSQAMIRGWLARRKIQKKFGFKLTKPMMNRPISMIKDPAIRERLKTKMQHKRDQLDDFHYGLYDDEDQV